MVNRIFVVHADDTYCDLISSLFEDYDETQITFFRDDSLKDKNEIKLIWE